MFDVNVAKQQIRGGSLLEDAGEILVSHTYLVMNDIYYVDKSNKWQIVKDGLNVATSLAEPWLLGTTSTITDNDNPFESSYAWLYGGVLDNVKGFRVRVTSYLFRLKWNDEIAQRFYTQFYTEEGDIEKVKAFQTNKSL